MLGGFHDGEQLYSKLVRGRGGEGDNWSRHEFEFLQREGEEAERRNERRTGRRKREEVGK